MITIPSTHYLAPPRNSWTTGRTCSTLCSALRCKCSFHCGSPPASRPPCQIPAWSMSGRCGGLGDRGREGEGEIRNFCGEYWIFQESLNFKYLVLSDDISLLGPELWFGRHDIPVHGSQDRVRIIVQFRFSHYETRIKKSKSKSY